MAVKGKEVAGKGKSPSTSKRKAVSKPDDSANTRASKRNRSNALKFFDDEAVDAGISEEDEDDSENELGQDFIDDEPETNGANKIGRQHHLPFLLKEEELSDDELEKLLKERYGRGSNNVVYADENQDTKDYNDRVHSMNSAKDPTIWRVKCMVGRERQIAFCLMQKFVDLQSFGTKLHMISAFALDHMKGHIYIEADRECDVTEACKGLCSVYSSRLVLVPKNEVPHLLAPRNKLNDVSKGSWVRIKCGTYKGDLAQVVAVDDAQKKATIKMIPRIDLQAISLKLGGGGEAVDEVSVPAPRLISSHELEDFRPHIQYKRDRQTGEIFEIFDGLMLKNGYLYKKVSIASLSCWEIKPSAAEIQKFMCADGTSEDSEWLSVLYGGQRKSHSGMVDNVMSGASESTSETKEGDNYELNDLVLFGRKEFGVIVGVGKDDFQILNGDLERPDTVTVKLRELKNRISDKNFTARDSQKKIISINDSVRILKGPFKAQQGIVKHIYKGTLFILDYKQLENSGFFCAKPEFCKKIMYPKDACDGIADDEMAPPGFEKSSGSPDVSPKRPYQRSDSNQPFNSNSHGERDQTFSIGQTLRIRVGPLKGHLCRVVAIYRSDVTVKLDSQSKVLKVNCEHLSEVGVKSFGNVLRDSLHDLSASGFTGKPSDADPFGAFSNYNDHETGKDETADPWGIGNKVADSWGKETPSTGGQNVSWTKATDGSNGDKSSSEQIAHGWDRATVKTDIGSSSSDGWKKPNVQPGDQAGSWEVASEWGKDKLGSETQADHPTNGMSGWEKRNASTDQAAPWKKLEKTLEDGNNGSVSQKDAWNSQNVNLTGTEESNQDKGKGAVDDNQSSWNKGIGGSENVTTSWGKAVELQSNKISQANQLDVWGKASGTGNEGSGKNKADSWNNMTAADGIQTGGWANATGQKDKPEVGWGNQAGGWSKAGESGGWSESQDKSKYGNAGGWNKGSAGHGQPDGCSKPQPSGGDQASNWTKGGRSENWDKSKDVSEGKTVGWTEAGFASGSQTDSWNKPKSFGGDQSSNWNKGKAVNDDPGGREKDQGKIWNRSGDADGGWKCDWNKGMTGNTEIGGERNHEDNWNQPKTFDGGWRGGRRGGRGGTEGRGGGNRNHEDSWSQAKAFDGGQGAGWRGGRGGAGGRGRGGRPFGRGRSSDQSRDQGSHWDRDGESQSPAWNNNQAGGWNQGAATSGEANWKNVGRDTSGNTDRWNSENARGGEKSFGWTKETNVGGNREWSDKSNQAKSFGGDKSSGWNKRESENKDAPNWNGGSSFIGDQSSSWKKDVTSDKGNDGKGQLSAWSKGAVSDKGNDGNGGWANSWNTPKSFGQGQSSGWSKGDGDNDQSDSWKRTQGFGQGQSSHWQKEAGTDNDDGSRDQVDSWNKSKPYGRGQSFGRGQSSGRNGGAFGRGQGRRDQAGSWNKRNDYGNDGGGGTSEVDSWNQGDSSSKGQWSTWNKGTVPSKEKWGSSNQGGSGWNKETPPTNEGGVAGDRTNNWNSANASGGGQSSGWGKEEHVSSWNQAKTVERSFGGDGSSGWKKDPTANKGGGVSGQAESWSKGSWNAGNSSKHAEAIGGANQAGWNRVKVSDGTGSSNWNSTTSIKNTGGTDDAQPSGFTQGPVQGEGGSGNQAKSWGEGSHHGGDSHGWK